MRTRFLLAVLVAPVFFASAQSTAAKIDQWHGLKLALSTPDEALQALGKPHRDDKKVTREFNPVWGTSGIYSHVTVGSKEKLRKVTYAYRRAIDGFKSVELLFFREKLMFITLEPTTPIPFAEIQSTYGLELQLWNLSRYDQFVNRLQPDESPSTRLQLTGESGPLALLRTFYLLHPRTETYWVHLLPLSTPLVTEPLLSCRSFRGTTFDFGQRLSGPRPK